MPRKDSPRERGPRHIRLFEFMLASEAWRSLDPVARALYIEISRRYRGPNSTNGKIPYSVREAATALNVGRNTAGRAFHHLAERGFIVAKKRSGFNVKSRTSAEWLLTEFPDDTLASVNTARKTFMSWTPAPPVRSPSREPQNSSNSPTGETHSPMREPVVAPRRDHVAR
jgi:DNA-binding transcriptional MocR family regulator